MKEAPGSSETSVLIRAPRRNIPEDTFLLWVFFSTQCSRNEGDRAPRRIFGPKRDEVMGGWRKMYKEELHDFYSSPSEIKIIKSSGKWAGHV
jgi:hypothetical protein